MHRLRTTRTKRALKACFPEFVSDRCTKPVQFPPTSSERETGESLAPRHPMVGVASCRFPPTVAETPAQQSTQPIQVPRLFPLMCRRREWQETVPCHSRGDLHPAQQSTPPHWTPWVATPPTNSMLVTPPHIPSPFSAATTPSPPIRRLPVVAATEPRNEANPPGPAGLPPSLPPKERVVALARSTMKRPGHVTETPSADAQRHTP